MAETNISDGNRNASGLDGYEPEVLAYYRLLARNIYISVTSVLLFFGLLGNVLSLIVWNKGPRCRVLSCALYFKILALSDIYVLISYNAIRLYVEFNILDLVYKHCELFSICSFLAEIGPHLSPWIIVTLSVERTLSILCPLKCLWKPSKKRAWISFGCIIIILVILHCLWTFRIRNSEISFTLCSIPDLKLADLKFSKTLNIWVLGILPFTFIMVCNILILIQMFQMRKLKGVSGRGRRTEAFATFTILTVVTGFLHCVSVIPMLLNSIALTQYLENEDKYNFLQIYQGHALYDLFWLYFPPATILLNNSLNFYVYCLAGRDFRKDFRHVLTCCSTRNNTRVQNV